MGFVSSATEAGFSPSVIRISLGSARAGCGRKTFSCHPEESAILIGGRRRISAVPKCRDSSLARRDQNDMSSRVGRGRRWIYFRSSPAPSPQHPAPTLLTPDFCSSPVTAFPCRRGFPSRASRSPSRWRNQRLPRRPRRESPNLWSPAAAYQSQTTSCTPSSIRAASP